MKNVIDDLGDQVKEMISSRDAFVKSVDKNTLKEYINTLSTTQRNLVSILTRLTEPKCTEHFSKLIDDEKSNKRLRGVQSYLLMRSKLRNDAAKAENKTPLSAVKNTLVGYTEVLEDLEGQVDTLFQGKEVNIFNTRLSHVLLLGIVMEANLLNKYTKYLITGLLTDSNSDVLGEVVKYRAVFMTDNSQDFATVVTRSYNRTGAYNFNALVKDMKTKGVDVNLLDDMNNILLDQVNSSKINDNAKGLIKKGAFALDIFRWIGEKWVIYKQNRIQKIQTEKEWMEAHVALLLLDLEDLDPSDPEYQRLSKIIQKYEEMIVKSDRKISKHEEKYV